MLPEIHGKGDTGRQLRAAKRPGFITFRGLGSSSSSGAANRMFAPCRTACFQLRLIDGVPTSCHFLALVGMREHLFAVSFRAFS